MQLPSPSNLIARATFPLTSIKGIATGMLTKVAAAILRVVTIT